MHEGFRTQSGAQMAGIRRRGMSDEGMTLPEVMIAASILLVCLTSLAGLLGGAITSSTMTRSRDEATNLANARLEGARGLPYDSVGLRYPDGSSGEPPGTILTPEQVGRFLVTTECSWVQAASGRSAYKRLKVTVAWTSPMAGQVEVNTIIYGKSGISGAGDFLVKLRNRESPDPVTGTEVTLIAADGSTHRYSTDAAGEVLFGQVPVGPCTLSVAAPAGYIVDTSTLVGVAVSVDAVSTAIVYLQLPSQATVHVADANGTPLVSATVTIRRSDGAVSASTVTNSSGVASFSQLLYGDYTATVTHSGYADADLPFAVTLSDAAPVVQFVMSPGVHHGVRVRVFDSNGTQVPGATVVVKDQGGSVVNQGVTGSNGEISFSITVVGNYTVTVSKAEYTGGSQVVTIHDEHDEEVVTFSLAAVQTKGNMHILTKGKNNKLQSLRVVVSGPGGYFRNDLWSSASVGQVGELWLNDLVPGSYSVQIYDDAGSAVTVIVMAGQTVDIAVSQRN
jgi:type II secretory pathway pseudopilin PulG